MIMRMSENGILTASGLKHEKMIGGYMIHVGLYDLRELLTTGDGVTCVLINDEDNDVPVLLP
jgi:hypothetical protein